MSRFQLRWPGTIVISVIAGLATWVTLLAWTPFSERPAAYMGPLLFACLLVAVVGASLRTMRIPAILVAIAQVLVLAVWLHHRWAGADAWFGWLPTPESLDAMGATLSASVQAAQEFPSPVPRSVTEFAPVMIVAGAATAVLVDLIACGWRRAPIAGLPLLAAYTAPVSILDGGVSWLKFALAALMFLLLIVAQESTRLTHWGQQVSHPGRPPDPFTTGQAVWTSARKIGVSATGLAVLVPLLVPTLSLAWFDGGRGVGGGDSVTLENPIANMRRDLFQGEDIDLVRVETPGDRPSYLRISVLDVFDGETWRPSERDIPVEQRATGLVPRPPGLDASVERRTSPWSVEVSDQFDSQWLPVPYPVYSINTPGDWRYDRRTLDFYSAVKDQVAAGMRYDLEEIQLDPTDEQLAEAAPAPASVFGPSTELPDDVPDIVADLAAEATEGADTKYEQAVALQRWFRTDGGFEYSLDRAETKGNGFADLEEFLSDTGDGRIGYCEQFAASMAVMARSLSIPARVAIGFLRPDTTEDGYVFSSSDMHAWPELYFEGTGWVRFEPTPGQRTGRVPAYTRAGGEPDAGPSGPSSSASGTQGPARIDQPTAPAGAGSSSSSSGGADLGGVLVGLGALALAVAMALAPRTARAWRRRRRWAAATTPAGLAEAAWAELRDTALDLGVAWSDSVTLRTRALELVRSFGRPGAEADSTSRAGERGPSVNPEATAALERLVHRLEVARYARSVPAGADQRAEAEADLALCVAALAAGASRQRRTMAVWLPASLAGWRSTGITLRRGGLMEEPGVDHAV